MAQLEPKTTRDSVAHPDYKGEWAPREEALLVQAGLSAKHSGSRATGGKLDILKMVQADGGNWPLNVAPERKARQTEGAPWPRIYPCSLSDL